MTTAPTGRRAPTRRAPTRRAPAGGAPTRRARPDRGPARPSRAAGFSLVEILISLVLASMAILAVMAVYSNSRETYTAQDEIGRLHENQRIGNAILERTLRQGAHKRIPTMRDANPLLVAAFGFAPVDGIDGAGTAIGASDTIEITYNGSTDPVTGSADGLIVDCLGAAVASDVQSRNRFRVRADADGRPWLACSTDGGTTWTPLIADVEALEVLYGLYSSENRSVTSFVPWGSVTDPMRVVALKLFVLYRSGGEIAPTPSPQTHALAERTYGPFTDRYLRSVSELTIVIRSTAL